MVVLRKANTHSVVITNWKKKINNVDQIKNIQEEKLIQTLIFPKLPSAYELLIIRNAM